jgi:hypothetical protein
MKRSLGLSPGVTKCYFHFNSSEFAKVNLSFRLHISPEKLIEFDFKLQENYLVTFKLKFNLFGKCETQQFKFFPKKIIPQKSLLKLKILWKNLNQQIDLRF